MLAHFVILNVGPFIDNYPHLTQPPWAKSSIN